MSAFDWNDDAFWQIQIDESQLADFTRPYVGTGSVGVRFAELILAPWSDAPLSTITNFLYDDGSQLWAPAWNHVDLKIGGALFAPGSGRHRFTQTLDLRTGEVTLTDDWEYRPGNAVTVAVKLLMIRHLPHCGVLTLAVHGPDRACRGCFRPPGRSYCRKLPNPGI